MARAKEKIKHPNDSTSLSESKISASFTSMTTTPPNLPTGSKVGGATPQFQPSF